MASKPVKNDVQAWIEENHKFFEPPICNKLMHQDGQLKIFFVGGPNKRNDFHLEEGEEFFYMLKGDMCLKVMEQGKFKDVVIKEGEVFLLPSRVLHSPQRQADTLGLVIERERLPHELDCLRYFVEGTTDVLYERWFYCQDLGNLAPLIKEFFASEEYKTGKPLPGSVSPNPPYTLDGRRTLSEPFSLDKWIKAHRSQIDAEGFMHVFDRAAEACTTEVVMFGKGLHERKYERGESFLWQWEGTSQVKVGEETYHLEANHSLLVPAGQRWSLHNTADSLTLVVAMDPDAKLNATETTSPRRSQDQHKESPER